MPAAADAGSSAEGDVITQDRSTTALETEKVLDDLLPLLQSLQAAGAVDDAQRAVHARCAAAATGSATTS